MRQQRSPIPADATGRSHASATAHARRLDTPVTPAPAIDHPRSALPALSPKQRAGAATPRGRLMKERPPFTLSAAAPTPPPAAWTPFKNSPRLSSAASARTTPRIVAAPSAFTPRRSPQHTHAAQTSAAKAIPSTPKARWEQAMRETRRESRPTNAATPLGLARSASSFLGSPLASSSRIVRVEHSDIASLLHTLQRLDPSGDHKYVQQLASRLMKDKAGAAATNGPKHISFRMLEPVESFVRAIHTGQLFAGGADAEEAPFSQTQRRPPEASPAKLQPSMDTVPADEEEEVAFSQTQTRLSFHAAEEKQSEDAEEEFVPATQHTMSPPLRKSFAVMQLQSRSPTGVAKQSDATHTPSPATNISPSRGFVNPFATSPQLAAGLLAALETQPQPSLLLQSSQALQSPPPPPLSKDHFNSESLEPLRPASMSLRLNPSLTPAAAAAVAVTPRSILKHAGSASAAAVADYTPSLSLNFEEAADEDAPSQHDRDAAVSSLRPGSADDRKHASAHSPAAVSCASSKEWSLPHPAAAVVAAAPQDAPVIASANDDSQDQAAAVMIEAMLPLDFDSLRPLSELPQDQQQQRDSDDEADSDGRAKEERVQFDLSGLSRQHREDRDSASDDDDRASRSRQHARSAGELQPPTIGAPGSTQLTPRGADTPLDSRRSSRRASHARTPSWARSVARSSPPQSEAQSDEEDDEEDDADSRSATPPLTQLSPARVAPSLPHTQLHSALRSTFMESQLEYDAMSQAVFGGQRTNVGEDREPREAQEDEPAQADEANGAGDAEPSDDPPLQSNHSALYDPPSQSRTVVDAAPAVAPPSPPRFSEYDLVADDPISDPVVPDRSAGDGGWRLKKAVVTREAELDSIPVAQLAAPAPALAPAVRVKSFQKASFVRNASLTAAERLDASSSSAIVAAAVPLPVWKKSKAQTGAGVGYDASDSSASSVAPVRRIDRRSGVSASAVAPVTAVLPPPKPKRAPRAEPPPIVDPLVPASAISQPKVDPRRQASRIQPLQLTNYLRAPTSVRGGPVEPQQTAPARASSSKSRRASSPVESIDLCSPDGSSQQSEDGLW